MNQHSLSSSGHQTSDHKQRIPDLKVARVHTALLKIYCSLILYIIWGQVCACLLHLQVNQTEFNFGMPDDSYSGSLSPLLAWHRELAGWPTAKRHWERNCRAQSLRTVFLDSFCLFVYLFCFFVFVFVFPALGQKRMCSVFSCG